MHRASPVEGTSTIAHPKDSGQFLHGQYNGYMWSSEKAEPVAHVSTFTKLSKLLKKQKHVIISIALMLSIEA